jgi:hypothetical protein
VHETPEDLARLQRLHDVSYDAAGDHLSSIVTPERRVAAEALVERLEGMCLLVLATVSADGRPFTAAVDSIFHRGNFYFGSSPDSLRFRHIRANLAVSATHVPSEAFSVSVHGGAALVDVSSSREADVRQALIDVYEPLYGKGWGSFLDSGVAYARIDAARMFTFSMPPG